MSSKSREAGDLIAEMQNDGYAKGEIIRALKTNIGLSNQGANSYYLKHAKRNFKPVFKYNPDEMLVNQICRAHRAGAVGLMPFIPHMIDDVTRRYRVEEIVQIKDVDAWHVTFTEPPEEIQLPHDLMTIDFDLNLNSDGRVAHISVVVFRLTQEAVRRYKLDDHGLARKLAPEDIELYESDGGHANEPFKMHVVGTIDDKLMYSPNMGDVTLTPIDTIRSRGDANLDQLMLGFHRAGMYVLDKFVKRLQNRTNIELYTNIEPMRLTPAGGPTVTTHERVLDLNRPTVHYIRLDHDLHVAPTGITKQAHDRRGHWRHMKSGKVVFVRSCKIHGGYPDGHKTTVRVKM
jgi:hypothetical protein